MTQSSTVLLPVVSALAIALISASRRAPAGEPQAPGIDDMDVRANEVLLSCPFIANVQLLLPVASPSQRIIHIVDAHYAQLDEFSRIVRAEARMRQIEVSEHEIVAWHQSYVDRLERLRASQACLLCWLVDRHALDHVFREGAFPEEMSLFFKTVEDYRLHGPSHETLAAEMRSLLSQIEREAQATDASALRQRLRHVESQISISMNLGATGDLLIARPTVNVLPAEDRRLHGATGAEIEAGLFHGPIYKAREAAIVANLLAHPRCSVIVLGAAHDLSHEVATQSDGRCEYIRVIPNDFPTPALEPLLHKVLESEPPPVREREQPATASAVDAVLLNTVAGAMLLGIILLTVVRDLVAFRRGRKAGTDSGSGTDR